jgi:bacteriorhodopsin
MPTEHAASPATTSREILAFRLGVAALVSWVLAMIFAGDNDGSGWLWVVMAAFGVAAVVAGLRANPGRPQGRALVGVVIGGLLVLLFLGFVIAGG